MEPAIQVSPVEDKDMSFVRDIFEKMANNVLAATQLSQQVQAMQKDMEGLHNSVERLKNDVTYYSDQASAFRQKSEDLARELAQTKDSLSATERDYTGLQRRFDNTQAELSHAIEHVSTLTKDRDDAQMRVMELEDANKALTDKLDEIKDFASRLLGGVAANVPVQELPNPVPARQEPDKLPGGHDGPYNEPASEPAASPKRTYEGDPGFNWNLPTKWDSERNNYYNES